MTVQTFPRPRRRRRRLRTSVRVMMGIVLVLAVAMGLYVRSVRTQQAAVDAIRHAGGTVDYDWRWGNYNPDIIDNDGKWRAPKWLARLVPADYVANVVFASLAYMPRTNAPAKADDAMLALVGRLGRLEYLRLQNTHVTDAGMVHLAGLKRLRELHVENTAVGDAGIRHLNGLTGLRALWISDSRVTDEGVLELERALPDLMIYRIEEMVTSDNKPRAMDDLGWARTRPVRLAAALLGDRTRAMLARRDDAETAATVEALCALDADDKLSLIKLAEARSECIGLLSSYHSPHLPQEMRQRLEQLCSDRGIAAVAKAIELGYDNVRRLEGDFREARMLWNLRLNPAYQDLVEAIHLKLRGR